MQLKKILASSIWQIKKTKANLCINIKMPMQQNTFSFKFQIWALCLATIAEQQSLSQTLPQTLKTFHEMTQMHYHFN